MKSPADLLRLHDEQVRGSVADRLPRSWSASWDGPLLRIETPESGLAFSTALEDLSVAELDGLISRLRGHFSGLGKPVEWKTYGHDRADLPGRLHAAGFRPEPLETVVIGDATTLAQSGTDPVGISIRATTDPQDFRRIARLLSEVWNQDWSWIASDLADRVASAPSETDVLLAEVDGELASAAWLVGMPGTEFSGLWGGSTGERWRGRGIYQALVAHRARLSLEKGRRYLVVDASPDSRPILERLGFQRVTTTTPWVWSPEAG